MSFWASGFWAQDFWADEFWVGLSSGPAEPTPDEDLLPSRPPVTLREFLLG